MSIVMSSAIARSSLIGTIGRSTCWDPTLVLNFPADDTGKVCLVCRFRLRAALELWTRLRVLEQAAAKLSEALEYVERARGRPTPSTSSPATRTCCWTRSSRLWRDRSPDLIETIRHQLYGLDVLFGRWTFEVVEEFDSGFYAAWLDVEKQVRQELTGGRRHTFEARLKAERQARGVKADDDDGDGGG